MTTKDGERMRGGREGVPASGAPAPAPGTLFRLGRYEVIRHLGAGGMADVYLAQTCGLPGFEKLVVLKVMRAPGLDHRDAVAGFLDEARIALRLSHPNLVSSFEVVEDGGVYFLVMEYVDGVSLSALRKAGAITLDLQIEILIDVLSALDHAHDLTDADGRRLGVVHRDVSGGNVMVSRNGDVKLLDFGVARSRTNHRKTHAGVVKGTLRYVAPETIRGEGVDRRADVYAVGVLLWEALTGKRFLEEEDQVSILLRVGRGDVPRPSSLARVDPLLEAIAMRAMSDDPRRRFASAREMRAALEAYPARSRQRSLVNEGIAAAVRRIAPPPARASAPSVDTPRPSLTTLREARDPAAAAAAASWPAPPLPPTDAELGIEAPPFSSAAPPCQVEVAPPVPRRRTRRGAITAAALGVIAVAALVGGVALRRREIPSGEALAEVSPTPATSVEPPSEVAAAPAVTPAPVASVAPAAGAAPADSGAGGDEATVTMSIGAFPRTALLTIDGKRMTCNPCEVKRSRGDAISVVAGAPGHAAIRQRVTFAQDRTFEVSLRRAPPRPGVDGNPY